MSDTAVDFTAGLMFSQEGGKPFLSSLLEAMRAIAPSLLPVRYGQAEPLKNKFAYENMHEIVNEDDQYLLWKTKNGFFGQWSTGMHLPIKTHNRLCFYGERAALNARPFLILFDLLSRRHGVDYGWIHTVCDQEFAKYKTTAYNSISPFNTGPTTHVLQKWLPNLV